MKKVCKSTASCVVHYLISKLLRIITGYLFSLGMKNRVGNIPLEWYKDHDHIGYDISGKKIIRKPKKDALDKLLDRRDPNAK